MSVLRCLVIHTGEPAIEGKNAEAEEQATAAEVGQPKADTAAEDSADSGFQQGNDAGWQRAPRPSSASTGKRSQGICSFPGTHQAYTEVFPGQKAVEVMR